MHKIDRYVVIGAPSSPVWFKLVTSSIDQFIKSWYIAFFQAPFIPELLIRSFDFQAFDELKRNGVTDEDIEAYKYTFSQEGALTAPLNYYRANARFLNPTKPLKRPTEFSKGLYMLGEQEKYISMDSGQLQQKYSDNLQFKVIKGASHFCQQDAPEEINRLIREFLNE